MLYETIINIADKVVNGMNLARGINTSIISNKVIEWTIPEIGVLPPFLTLAAVLAIAPVAGIPPNREEPILAIPCAISSAFELCLSPIIPSETTADNKDSIPPKSAIVKAGPINAFNVLRFRLGIWGIGIFELILPNWLPIVATGKLNINTTKVVTIKAIKDPGIFLFIFGQKIKIISASNPIANV